MDLLQTQLAQTPRALKRGVSVLYDVLAIATALYIAFAIRLGESYHFSLAADLYTYALTTIISVASFIRLGLYRAVLRYMTYQAIYTVVLGIVISAVALIASSFFTDSFMPRSVPVIYVFAALLLVGFPRLIIRNLVQISDVMQGEKVIIYGAGVSGSQLAAALQLSPDYQPVAFIDDNKKLHNSSVRGLNIFSFASLPKLMERYQTDKVLLALGRTPRAKRHEVVKMLETMPVQIQTVPNMAELLSGRANLNDIKDIEIEDLLGRDPSLPDYKLMAANIKGKTVLVTGAGGSIGSELCQQIAQLQPKALLMLEQNEYNLYRINEELREYKLDEEHPLLVKTILGSAADEQLIARVFRKNAVDTVYHAAAYKHVPMLEDNKAEGLRNNVLSTWYTAKAAVEYRVDSFVLISSDKAVRPTNIMGASKRIAELILQAMDAKQQHTRFCMVRFGNVLGSSGSVVPHFKEQIASGGPITVTHPDITRYFMVTSEAVQLVIQAGAMGSGGDVFVLDMGEPVRISDLAKEMILLSGLQLKDEHNPDGDVEIHYTGLRAGEKLYEELLVKEECERTRHPRIMRSCEEAMSWDEVNAFINTVKELDGSESNEDIASLLQASAIHFQTQQPLTPQFRRTIQAICEDSLPAAQAGS
ncbi:polysaccharide biosynthesis protein [Pseudoteredinibacter isoporae]|uniref:polysaccharide biosynthesis protein n=1 Tax=Pseudoteredinibacter isoporae TaxID=570281 RepID=UPI00142330B4|nr:nucleoside-diphosphate sugar epimerase/dehydratase [Pseudoteredinibacter isoporae]